MQIKLHFHGILADWVGTSATNVHLENKVLYSDLLMEIGRLFGTAMPEQLWDGGKNSFKGQVLGVKNGKNLTSLNTPLAEGELITFFLMIAGG